MCPGPCPTTLPNFFEKTYLPLRLTGSSPSTIATYRAAVKHWMRSMGAVPVGTINTTQFAAFQACLLDTGVGPVSNNTYCRHLMVLLRYAADEDVALLDRPPKWRKLKEPKRSPLAFTVDEFRKVLATARAQDGEVAGYPASDWWAALLLTCWDTGLRHSALLLLRSVDVVWDSGGLYCQAEAQKNNEAQWFDLSACALEAIRPIHETSRELLFPRDVSIDCVGRWFRNILNRAEIYAPKGAGQRFHRIRRSKASYTEILGGNPTQALGHSGRSVTERYFDPRIVTPVKQPPMPAILPDTSLPDTSISAAPPVLRVFG